MEILKQSHHTDTCKEGYRMQNITQLFVDYLFHKSMLISEPIKQKAYECKLDYLAVTVAGAAKNRKRWEAILGSVSSGKAELLGYIEKVDSKTAALINGFNAHSLELDDGQRFAMIHLGASIISAIHAASADYTIDQDAFLYGIVLGYEAACRISIAMQPSHKNLGYHTAGTCGTIGSAIGVAFALGMDKDQLKRVISIAAGSSAGMLEMQEQESEVKPYNLGRAAMDGLSAAYMGFTDFAVPDDMLGGERGFLKLFSNNRFDSEKLTQKTDYYEIERIYVKPYASCRHSHSAVEAAIHLHDEIEIERVESVVVETYKLGVKGHDDTAIHGISSAKLSTPYAVAAALIYGKADLSVFEPLDDKAVSLASKIKIVENEELTKECPSRRIAIVTVKMLDGTLKTQRVDYAKGEPENPMTKKELNEKSMSLNDFAENQRRKTV